MQAPKARNWLASKVVDPNGPFRERTIKDKSKGKQRPKHKKRYDKDDYE